jgi:hypothetical protein
MVKDGQSAGYGLIVGRSKAFSRAVGLCVYMCIYIYISQVEYTKTNVTGFRTSFVKASVCYNIHFYIYIYIYIYMYLRVIRF